MRVIFCALVIALTGMPGLVVAAQSPSNQDLSKRIEALDRRVDRLERREKTETKAEKKEKRAEAKAKAKEK